MNSLEAVLEVVKKYDGCSIECIVEESGVCRKKAVICVNKLVRQGYLTRTIDRCVDLQRFQGRGRYNERYLYFLDRRMYGACRAE